MISGIGLAIIFQVTHISDRSVWVELDDTGSIDNSFARHILETTADFCTQSKFITWLAGGLNIHVAHHLFPAVSQAHLPALAKIIQETSIEFQMPYKEYDSVTSALISHLNTIKRLGRNEIFTV